MIPLIPFFIDDASQGGIL